MKKNQWRKLGLLLVVLLVVMTIGITAAAKPASSPGKDKYMDPDYEEPLPSSVNPPLATKEPAAAILEVQGKVDPALKEKLNKMSDIETVAIAISIDGGNELNAVADRESIDVVTAESQHKANVATKEKPVVDFLKEKKASVKYQSTYAPLVFATVNKTQVEDLEKRSDVGLITFDNMNTLETNTALQTVLAPYYYGMVSGSDKVAVVEDDGIAYSSPYLVDGLYYRPSTPNVGSHATMCAGVIASTDATYHGALWSAPAVLSANAASMSDSDLIAAMDWAISQGAEVLSCSWGINACSAPTTYSSTAIYADTVTVTPPYTNFVTSAGNNGPSCYIQNPKVSFNSIVVGSFNDKQTPYNLNDDDMSYFSTVLNTFGRDKPEVAAVGAHNYLSTGTGPNLVGLTTASPWTGSVGVGTSYAAPQVAALAAAITQDRTALRQYPELVKAVIMASADNNIEGSSRMSDADGAGGINMAEAIKIAPRSKQAQYGTIYKGSNEDYILPALTLSLGQKCRMVFVYDGHVIGGVPQLNSDLDLWVRTGSATGPVIASSTYANNNFEIVEFTATSSSKYYPVIDKFDWHNSGIAEVYGFAFSLS